MDGRWSMILACAVLCDLCVCPPVARAAAAAAPSAATVRAARASLTRALTRHKLLVASFERYLTTELRRAENPKAVPVNVRQLLARLAAYRQSEARLATLETRLGAIPSVPDAATRAIEPKIEAERAMAAELLGRLAGLVKGIPESEIAWWSRPPEPSPGLVAGRPHTPAQLEALLLTLPPDSWDGLFAVVGGIDKSSLPGDQ